MLIQEREVGSNRTGLACSYGVAEQLPKLLFCEESPGDVLKMQAGSGGQGWCLRLRV